MLKVIMLRKKQDQLEKREAELRSKLAGYKQREDELAQAIAAATEKLEKGEIHVFDCANFTVKGEALTSYMADVNADSDNTPDTEVVHDGYFSESEFRSAPYFDLQIDGINLLNVNFG